MAPAIEARTLSDLTHLASNPPKYPRNPTEEKRQPLTLYIVRVPGSKDVILTTLKPQQKNVTATDVAASLYYFHLNTEDDSRLLAEAEALHLEENEHKNDKRSSFPRKPLPETARSSLDLHRVSVLAVEPLLGSSPNSKITRKAVAPTKKMYVQRETKGDGEIARKLLGPRPPVSDANVSRKPLSSVDSRLSSSGPGISGHVNAAEGRDQSTATREMIGIGIEQQTRSSKEVFSVTIIRRDLASGAQWNVGTITGEELKHDQILSATKKSQQDISVCLTTAGYGQFRNTPTIDKPKVSDAASIVPTTAPMAFTRHIVMEGTSFWDRSTQHKRTRSDAPSTINSVPRGRAGSTDSLGTVFPKSPTHEQGMSHSKGYVFTSPWSGRCKFATSGSGRSLRCNHTLPSPVSASHTNDEGSSSQVAVASELRFNLPTSSIFQSSISPKKIHIGKGPNLGHFRIPKINHIRNKLSPDKSKPALPSRPPIGLPPGSYAAMYPSDDDETIPPRPTSQAQISVDGWSGTLNSPQATARWTSDEEDYHLDLSLGQEKAGGGNSGSRVKLGKLIIFDEGFKMMDLIVAANMGIWWSTWETKS
ncbi:hypothetical protein BJ878DRAFT_304907 [Calycina marina]|uniref:Oxidoreductase-like protein n=1 Tax=Calycina marina TaxID=1763456 RepID=A0A9P7Z6I3_9HELO|nr:hypothetical protein BJ878DRAFT_304907 [Calycina marina]